MAPRIGTARRRPARPLGPPRAGRMVTRAAPAVPQSASSSRPRAGVRCPRGSRARRRPARRPSPSRSTPRRSAAAARREPVREERAIQDVRRQRVDPGRGAGHEVDRDDQPPEERPDRLAPARRCPGCGHPSGRSARATRGRRPSGVGSTMASRSSPPNVRNRFSTGIRSTTWTWPHSAGRTPRQAGEPEPPSARRSIDDHRRTRRRRSVVANELRVEVAKGRPVAQGDQQVPGVLVVPDEAEAEVGEQRRSRGRPAVGAREPVQERGVLIRCARGRCDAGRGGRAGWQGCRGEDRHAASLRRGRPAPAVPDGLRPASIVPAGGGRRTGRRRQPARPGKAERPFA